MKRTEQKTKWEEYKEVTRKCTPYSLQGKGVEEIDEVIDELTGVIKEAVDRWVPKIRARKLPHSEIDQETRSMMEEARRIKIQMVNGGDFVNNRRR